jgi:protein-S-isoprenylcysteine O-methyltransferase Ste14
MLPPVLAHPPGRAAFQLASLLWLAEETVIGFRQRLRDRSLAHDRGSRPVVAISVAGGAWIALTAAAALPGAAITFVSGGLIVAGLTLMLLGIGLRWYAVRTLGAYFTTTVATRAGQPIIEVGPYRLVRHPSYAAILMILLGFCLALTNLFSFLGLVPAAIGLGYRIRVEERALLERLGEDYAAYMRRTKRLIPRVV